MPDIEKNDIQHLLAELKNKPFDTDLHLKLASAYEDVGNLEDAISVYNNLLSIQPRNALVHIFLGFIKIKQNSIPHALDSWEKALELSPESFQNLISPQTAFLYKSRIDEAIGEFTKQLSLNRGNAYAHYQLGSAYRFFGRLELALQCFKTAVEINPGLWEAYLKSGDAYNLLGQPKLAIEQYKLAAQINMKTPAPLIALAEIYMNENMLGLALKQIEIAVSLDQQNPRTFFILGKIHYNQSNFKMAILNFQKSLDLDPKNPIVHYNLAKACEGIYRVDFAITELERAIELSTDFAEAYYDLGILFIKTGETDKAIKNFEQAVNFNPKDSYAHYQLGLAKFKQNDNENAIKHLKKAVELNPLDSYAFYIMGQAYSNLNQYKQAIDRLSDAIKISPEEPSYYYQRGSLELDQCELEQAEHDLKKAISLKPFDADYRLKLASLFSQKGRYDLIISELDSFLQINKNVAAIYIFLAKAHFLMEEYRTSNQILNKALEIENDNIDAIYYKGMNALKSGHPEKAADFFKKILSINPDHIHSLCELADIEIKNGNTKEGFEKYEKALKVAEESEDEKVKVRQKQARILLITGSKEDGKSKFNELIAEFPVNPQIKYLFAQALYEIKEKQEALLMAENARDDDITNPEYNFFLGKIYASLGRFEEAKEAFYSVIRFFPAHKEAQKALHNIFKNSHLTPEEAEAEIIAATEKGELQDFADELDEPDPSSGILAHEESSEADQIALPDLVVPEDGEHFEENNKSSLEKNQDQSLSDKDKQAEAEADDFSLQAISSALNNNSFEWFDSKPSTTQPQVTRHSQPSPEYLSEQNNKEIQDTLLKIANTDFTGLNLSEELNSVDLGDFILVKKSKGTGNTSGKLGENQSQKLQSVTETQNKEIYDKNQNISNISSPEKDKQMDDAEENSEENEIIPSEIEIDVDEIEIEIDESEPSKESKPEQQPDYFDLESWHKDKIKKLNETKDTLKLREIAEEITSHEPTSPKQIEHFCMALIESGQNTLAIDECKKTMEAYGESLPLQLLLAKIFTLSERHSMASLQYQKMLRKNKEAYNINLLLARTYLKLNNLKAAKKSYWKYLEKKPEDIDTFIEYKDLLNESEKETEEIRSFAEKILTNQAITEKQKKAIQQFLNQEIELIEIEPDLDDLEDLFEFDSKSGILRSLDAIEDFDDEI